MKLKHRLLRFLARNSFQQQLYPPPSLPFAIRRYDEKDRRAVLELHDSNAPDRFPAGSRTGFERYLESGSTSFFVAESPAGEVIASGGVNAVGERVHALCYGLVAPAHHGRGIGSTMTLARLVFATREPGMHFSIIFAVPKSLSFYRRFGFTQLGTWKGEDQKDYPLGGVGYRSNLIKPVEAVLRKRGFLIEPDLPLVQSGKYVVVATQGFLGRYNLEFQARDSDGNAR